MDAEVADSSAPTGANLLDKALLVVVEFVIRALEPCHWGGLVEVDIGQLPRRSGGLNLPVDDVQLGQMAEADGVAEDDDFTRGLVEFGESYGAYSL